jgi:hypothetical protein
VLSYASVRLTAKDALRQLALQTLEKLGWMPAPEDITVNSSVVDNARVDMPLATQADLVLQVILPKTVNSVEQAIEVRHG